MPIERRTLLKGSAAAATATVIGGPFAGFVNAPVGAARRPSTVKLMPVKDKRDGVVRLHLPEGFNYRSFHDTSETVKLDDGTILPGNHDGMGAFRDPDGGVVLIRNHELNNPDPDNPDEDYEAFGGDEAPRPYDAAARGGTTTIHVNKRGRVEKAYTSLHGTMMNCSGGIMPWGSWITCEETINGPDVAPDFTGASNVPLEKPHGYIFEVPVEGRASRRPITRAGRFAHEAVSFDPVGGALYLTEDNFGFASGFYRYTPRRNPMVAGKLDNDGELEMLAVRGTPNKHLEGHQEQGATYRVRWVKIKDPNIVFPYTKGVEATTSNNDAIRYVGDQGRRRGAAYFSRLEGQVYDDGVVYFASTQGGGDEEETDANSSGYGQGFGQIWAYDTREETLTCVYQSPGPEVLDFPDNVTTSPRGTLVLCEDHDDNNFLRGLSPNGKLWDIALNRIEGNFDAEFAGSTFSTDGETLFVNIQDVAGMTFAIWGPWRKIGV
jgi:secreted PhoX family phosphatase